MNDATDAHHSVAVLLAGNDLDAKSLRELQHYAELGRLSASLLHEISNPLAAISIQLDEFTHTPHPDNIRHVRRNLLVLQRYVEAARQQVRHEGARTRFYVRPELDQVKRILLPLARAARIQLKISANANFVVFGDGVKFQQIVANLVRNAIDAYDDLDKSPRPRVVEVKLSCKQQWLIIEVKDYGRGISASQMPNIFEPFYSTKNSTGRGLGIGLTTVKQYTETDFGGSVHVVSSPGMGTRFTIKLRISPRYQG